MHCGYVIELEGFEFILIICWDGKILLNEKNINNK